MTQRKVTDEQRELGFKIMDEAMERVDKEISSSAKGDILLTISCTILSYMLHAAGLSQDDALKLPQEAVREMLAKAEKLRKKAEAH